jgi:hypothetical protein
MSKNIGEANMAEKEKANPVEETVDYKAMYEIQKSDYERLLETVDSIEKKLIKTNQKIQGGINNICLSLEKALNDMIDCSSETRFALLYAKEMVKNIMSD